LGGFHRLYTGHTFSGLLQLLTLGGFLIWQILDLLSILAGAFRDSEGKLGLKIQLRMSIIVVENVYRFCEFIELRCKVCLYG